MTTAAALLSQAQNEGVVLVPDPPTGLKLRGAKAALERWAPILRPHKAALVALLTPPLSARDQTLVTAALDRLGEDDPQTRAEVLARCATDPDALAFWTAPAPQPDPRQALYRRWLAGIDQPSALLTLDPTQVREAVAAGVVTRDLARASVLLLVRSPAGDLGPGAVGLLAVPKEKYAGFSPAAALQAMGSIN